MTRLLLVPLALALSTTALAIPGQSGEEGDGEWFPGEDDHDPSTGTDDPERRNEIVNGRLAESDEFLEVVYLDVGGGACTGSVIDPEGYWVLTAAHCLDEDTPQTGITVIVGDSANNPVQQAQSISWVRNDNWDDLGEASQGKDIAVIELATPLDVFPMALNDQSMDESWLDLEVTITGFGKTASNKNDGGTKRVAETEIVSIGEINAPDDGDLADQFLNFNGNQSTCQGDSGGPTIARVGDGYVQIGITSWGGVPCGSTVRGKIRVDKYIGWLLARGVPFTTAPGSPPSFVCNRRLDEEDPASRSLGVVPFDLKCEVDYHSPEELTSVTWQWGDGTSSEGLKVEHTYERAGNFTVRMCAGGGGEDENSGWKHCVERPGIITACDVPTAGFEIEPVEGLTWQVKNRTDVSTYGCITNLVWEVYDENDELVEEYGGWEPEITFEEAGEYRIVQNVGGFAGSDAAELTVKARRRVGACNSVGGTGTLGAFGLLLGAALLRRRRRSA